MTTFDRLEPRFAELLDELAPAAVPDYLGDLLERSGSMRQRSAWRSIARWVLAGVAARRGGPSARNGGRLALLGVAAAVAVLVGSSALLSTLRPGITVPGVGASGAPSPNESPAGSASQSPAGSASQSPRSVGSWTDLTDLPEGGWSSGSSTRLHDGRVLILGYDFSVRSQTAILDPDSGVLRAQLWDPVTDRLSDAGTVEGNTFESHSATLLADGTVLIAGGLHGYVSDGPIATAMTWDPATGAFTPTGPMVTKRSRPFVVALGDGRALVLGGSDGNGDPLTAETYDPGGRSFTALYVRPSPGLLEYSVVTPLADGRVLVLGRAAYGACTEIWDVSPAGLSISDPVRGGCEALSATLLPDGRVLVVSAPATGSIGPLDASLRIAALFDPTRGTYSPAGVMSSTDLGSVAVALADGRVLFTGGKGLDGASTAVTEMWDPAISSFTPSASMSVARTQPDTTLLEGGRVLVVGGWGVTVDSSGESWSAISSLEVFDPR